ncbi:MAG: NADPH-dependent assimilatory sulfite reductase hemoprotein subunit, partial [Candidatus Dormiibacterota bacterium]
EKRAEARRNGESKHWQMMVRTKTPGGRVTSEAYLAHDAIAEQWGNGTLRITTREAFQLHGVLKGDLKPSIQAINGALMTTLGGCGDQVRNTMTCPLPPDDPLRAGIQGALQGVVAGLAPRTRAYHEIWLDGEKLDTPEAEPLYGDGYLPRKFKVGIAPEGDNCVDIYSHDLGLVAMRGGDGGLDGFTVLVGGGLGRTHHKPETYPAVSQPLGFCRPDQVVELSQAIVAVQRDFGDRENRRHARMKYLIADRGIDWFRDRVRERISFQLQPARPLRWDPVDDHLGWHADGHGTWSYGIFVENGRIKDEGRLRLRSALREIAHELSPQFVLTPQQNLLVTGLDEHGRRALPEVLRRHRVPRSERVPSAIRHSMACPAIPTCGLAVAQAERVLPSVVREIDDVLRTLRLTKERISIRMTGCPNGCARPYIGDVGMVGTTLGKYDLYLAGDFTGTRLNELYAHNVPLPELTDHLRPVLGAFAEEREHGETFGDWCARQGVEALQGRFLATPVEPMSA